MAMATPSDSSRRRLTDRIFTVAVILLWVAAAALGAYCIWQSQAGSSDAGTHPTTATDSSGSPAADPDLPTTTQAPTTTTTPSPPVLTVAAGGDVLGDRGVGRFMDANGGPAVFAGVKPYMEGADIGFLNLEGPISDTGRRNTAKEYTFRARVAMLDGLLSAGINVVSLANNHSLDYGWTALADCLARLDAAGVYHPGVGANYSEASAPVMIDTPAGKVAVVAASEITSSFARAPAPTSSAPTTTRSSPTSPPPRSKPTS
jgi:hypothetical protein